VASPTAAPRPGIRQAPAGMRRHDSRLRDSLRRGPTVRPEPAAGGDRRPENETAGR